MIGWHGDINSTTYEHVLDTARSLLPIPRTAASLREGGWKQHVWQLDAGLPFVGITVALLLFAVFLIASQRLRSLNIAWTLAQASPKTSDARSSRGTHSVDGSHAGPAHSIVNSMEEPSSRHSKLSMTDSPMSRPTVGTAVAGMVIPRLNLTAATAYASQAMLHESSSRKTPTEDAGSRLDIESSGSRTPRSGPQTELIESHVTPRLEKPQLFVCLFEE